MKGKKKIEDALRVLVLDSSELGTLFSVGYI